MRVVTLTGFAAVTRYPGVWSGVLTEQYQEALDLARPTVRWAEEVIGGA